MSTIENGAARQRPMPDEGGQPKLPLDDLTGFLPDNRSYGDGVVRRRVRLEGSAGRVDAALVDSYHKMSLTLFHDGAVVTGFDGAMERYPTTACPGAVAHLRTMVGLPLDAVVNAGKLRRENCSHLFDTAVLAASHAARGGGMTELEAVIPDETDQAVTVECWQDGDRVLAWRVRRGVILDPPELAGRSVLNGFTRWAPEVFAGAELDAARLISATAFIALGQRYQIEFYAGEKLAINTLFAGACYAFAPERVNVAELRSGQIRDFTVGFSASAEREVIDQADR